MINKQELLYDLFQAYYNTRRNKRNTNSAIKFELNYEEKIFSLWEDLINSSYKIKPSTCFIINDPVQREIFAANFRDRIIHHLIYNYIYDVFDKQFIYYSYSCRLGKGTHFGVKRVEHFIRSCSHNYSKNAYILKMDIQGFFMNINKHILFRQIEKILFKNKAMISVDYDFILKLIHQVIFNDPTKNCIIKGSKDDRDGLPSSKSLFNSPTNVGLAIGSLTSQLFANIYLDCLDKYIKYTLGFKYYGRYVDDFIIIHTDKQILLEAIHKIKTFLKERLQLILHPKKIYLQHYSKGVLFLGAYIKPYRTYIRKRTIGNFRNRIQKINSKLEDNDLIDKNNIQSIINSYLGILSHHKSYKIRKKMLSKFNRRFRSIFHRNKYYNKVIPNIRKLKKSEIKKLYPEGYYHGKIR